MAAVSHMPTAHALSLRVLFQVLRMTQEVGDPIVVQISLPGRDRTDNVRSKRLTLHSTAEFDPKLTCKLALSRHSNADKRH